MSKNALSPAASIAATNREPPTLDPELQRILGPPPLYEGEDKEAYDHLQARLRSAVIPQDVIEEIWVRDLADLVWETLRLRRLKARLMDAASVSELERLRRAAVPQFLSRQSRLANLGGDKAAAESKVDDLLGKASTDRGILEALTLSARLNDFERIDQLIMQSEGRRTTVLKEIDRHRDVLARRLREAVADIEDAEFEEVTAPDGGPAT